MPVLVDPDGVTVWDSLAIIEWACEHAATPLWPQDPKARAIARSVSAEMHAGFYALRKHCPMNIRRINPARERDRRCSPMSRASTRSGPIAAAASARTGHSCSARSPAPTAMYAPVVTRMRTYSLPVSREAGAYMEAMLAHPDFLEWEAAAREEVWTNPNSEVD